MEAQIWKGFYLQLHFRLGLLQDCLERLAVEEKKGANLLLAKLKEDVVEINFKGPLQTMSFYGSFHYGLDGSEVEVVLMKDKLNLPNRKVGGERDYRTSPRCGLTPLWEVA